MLKLRTKTLMLGALLVSSIGLTSTFAFYGSQTTYPSQLPEDTQNVQEQVLGPVVPERISAILASTGSKATASSTSLVRASVNSSTVKTAATATQTSRESGNQRTALYADLNSYVLSVVKSYQGKNYPYILNEDYANYNGVTNNVYYQDQLLLRAYPSGNHASYCVGITFETFFKAMQTRNQAIGLDKNSFNGMSFSQLQDFMLLWYTASGPKSVSNPAVAIVKYGLGQQITNWEAAKPGDFIDFSRTNGSGHSVIFLNWIRSGSKIIGLRYWSSQGSTNGLGYQEEYFSIPNAQGVPYGTIMTKGFYIGHVGPVANYRKY